MFLCSVVLIYVVVVGVAIVVTVDIFVVLVSHAAELVVRECRLTFIQISGDRSI